MGPYSFNEDTITFNFCEDFITPEAGSCNNQEAFAYIKRNEQCAALKAADDKADTVAVDHVNPDAGIVDGVGLQFTSDLVCDVTQNIPYTLNIIVKCDTEKEGANLISTEGTLCNPILTYESKSGCPLFSLGAFT